MLNLVAHKVAPCLATGSAQEIFGPVAVLAPYAEFDDALARVNDSRYGLQAGVFTRDLALVQRAFESLEVGSVLVRRSSLDVRCKRPRGGEGRAVMHPTPTTKAAEHCRTTKRCRAPGYASRLLKLGLPACLAPG